MELTDELLGAKLYDHHLPGDACLAQTDAENERVWVSHQLLLLEVHDSGNETRHHKCHQADRKNRELSGRPLDLSVPDLFTLVKHRNAIHHIFPNIIK